jgi:hypothetical protein
MPSATQPVRAFSSGIKKHRPVNRRRIDMSGNVISRSGRRPNRSMVKMAGMAKRKLMRPSPNDARRAEVSEKPAAVKMEAV